MNSIPPNTIPANTNYDNTQYVILQTNNMNTNYVSNNLITMQKIDDTYTKISGLLQPTNDLDAVPKSYINNFAPDSYTGSVQINLDGRFYGDRNLTYNNSTNVLAFTGSTSPLVFNCSGLVFNSTGSNNSISGVTFSTTPNSLCNIDFYKEFFTNTAVTTTSSGTSTYPVKNTIINVTNTNTVNLQNLADFQSSLYTTSVDPNTTFACVIINNYTTNVTINNNVGTGPFLSPDNFSFPVTISPNYNAYFYIKPDGTISLIYINQLVNLNNMFRNGSINAIVPTVITNQSYEPGTNAVFTASNLMYTSSMVNNEIIIRNPGADSTDSFDNYQTNASFIIKNISAHNITLSTSSSNGTWSIDPTSASLIPANGTISGKILYSNGTNTLEVLTSYVSS
jgi:hypothetical protein